MSIGSTQIDMQSFNGTIISLSLVFLAKLLILFNVMDFLQGAAYVLSILVACDTLTGSKIKNFFTPKHKRNIKK